MDPTQSRTIRLRDYRSPGEAVSLALTLTILLILYALAALYIATSWDQTIKAVAITLLGLGVYIISVVVQQRAAFGTLVRVGPRQFPELHERALLAAEFLTTPPAPIYVKRASEMMIYTLGLYRRPIIVVTSSLVDQMDLDNLQFFIGRELGHIKAGHTWLRTLLKPLGADVPVIGKLLNSVIFGDWINRTEYTADRAGFIACRSLTTAISTMLKFGVGVRLYAKLDISEFLEQIREVRNVRGRVTEIVAEQPYLTQRIRALVRFALSNQFQVIVPEKRTHTQILSALPQNYLSNAPSSTTSPPVEVAAEHPLEAKKAAAAPMAATVSPALGQTMPDVAAETDLEQQTVTSPSEESPNDPDPNTMLIAVEGGQVHLVRRQRTRIGRNRDNDMVIVNDRVSRYHGEIIREGRRWLIIDKGSRNGVWLNGWRIATPTELKSGDRLRIGRQEFTFTVRN
jgi:Zn-dependent protease with chaperone function